MPLLVIGLLRFIVTTVFALLFFMIPGRWPNWLAGLIIAHASLQKWRLEFVYLGRVTHSFIAPSMSMALTNLKGCVLWPILASVAGAIPGKSAIYFTVLTYLVGSAIWQFIDWPIRKYAELMFSVQWGRSWPFRMAVAAAWWITFAAVFYFAWHRFVGA